MTITSVPVHFYCTLNKPTIVDTYLVFILRSVLGYQLRSMTCMSRQTHCDQCMFHNVCVYCRFFETILDKENPLLEGRDRASHPFAFTQNSDFHLYESISQFDFTITLFGESIQYLPYIYSAFYNAGQNGIFSSRTKYTINDVKIHDKSILYSHDSLNMNFDYDVFNFSEEELKCNTLSHHEIRVNLISPLRFITNGEYAESFTADEFFSCLYRRFRIMFAMYGADYSIIDKNRYFNSVEINQTNLRTVMFPRYSARQRRSMTLNGVVGSFVLSGEFTPFMLKLLEFNKLANAGKNTNFGFGQLDYIIS